MADEPRVVLVGHCGPDMRLLQSAVRRALGDVELTAADDQRALDRQLGGASLLLINRVLDGHFSGGSGIELIRALSARPEGPAMMLISNVAQAQQEAQEAGAQPGFGKADVYSDEAAARLRQAWRAIATLPDVGGRSPP